MKTLRLEVITLHTLRKPCSPMPAYVTSLNEDELGMIRFYVQNLGEKVLANAPTSKMEERAARGR